MREKMKNKLLLKFMLFSILGVCNLYGMGGDQNGQSNSPKFTLVQKVGLENVPATVRIGKAEIINTDQEQIQENINKSKGILSQKLKVIQRIKELLKDISEIDINPKMLEAAKSVFEKTNELGERVEDLFHEVSKAKKDRDGDTPERGEIMEDSRTEMERRAGNVRPTETQSQDRSEMLKIVEDTNPEDDNGDNSKKKDDLPIAKAGGGDS